MNGHGAKSLMLGGAPFDAAGSLREAGLVVEALAQGLCVCEPDGQIVLANQVFRQYSSAIQDRIAELCRRAASSFRASPTDVKRRTLRVNMPQTGRFYEIVVSLLSPEGMLAGGGGGGAAESGSAHADGRVVALVRDVTPRERMRRKIVAIDQAGSELVRLDAETIQKMHVAERLKLLESKVVRFAHDLLHFDHFAIRLLNERTNELELVMSSGMSPKACAIKLYAGKENQGISGLVAATSQAYICADTSKDPRYVLGLEKCGSSLTVPLKLFGKVLGVFNVESNSLNAFTRNDKQFAEIFGHYIAMALYILNLLVVERYTTSQTTTGTVQGELSEPLNDLSAEAEALKDQTLDPETARHVERILLDVESIKRRMKNVARGPQTLLGAEEAMATSDIDPVLRGKHVLVVDNEEEIAGIIRDVLSRRGCFVTVCHDGASAQKLLLQWQLTHDADQGFELIISDINIGDATGYEVFASARNASTTVPVILMTGFGYDPHHSIVRASQEGLQCVIFKPFQVEKLVEEAKKALTTGSCSS